MNQMNKQSQKDRIYHLCPKVINFIFTYQATSTSLHQDRILEIPWKNGYHNYFLFVVVGRLSISWKNKMNHTYTLENKVITPKYHTFKRYTSTKCGLIGAIYPHFVDVYLENVVSSIIFNLFSFLSFIFSFFACDDISSLGVSPTGSRYIIVWYPFSLKRKKGIYIIW